MKILTDKDDKPILVDGKVICVDDVVQIKDVHINGSSIIDGNNVANLKLDATALGFNQYGVYIKDTELNYINNRSYNAPITARRLDYAVKASLSDGNSLVNWTAEEQKSAQKRLGVGKEWVLKGTLNMDNKNDSVRVDLSGCTELFIKSYIEATTSSSIRALINGATIGLCAGTVSNGTRYAHLKWEETPFGIENIFAKSSPDSFTSLATALNGVTIGNNAKISEITSFDFPSGVRPSISNCNVEFWAR